MSKRIKVNKREIKRNQMNQINQSSDNMESTKATNNAVITDPYVMGRTKGRKGYMENILTTEDTEDTEKKTDVIIARSRQLKANKIHFQLSTFNFQLITSVSYLQFCSFCNSVNSYPFSTFNFQLSTNFGLLRCARNDDVEGRNDGKGKRNESHKSKFRHS
jgi:hypothetical protein